MNFAIKRRYQAIRLASRTAWRNLGRPRIPGPWVEGSQHPESLLLVTLDSCRFDTVSANRIPVMSAIGPVHKAMAPSYFTYGSHAAMFVGFTPGDGLSDQPIVNPKCGKLVRLHGGGSPSKRGDRFVLRGRSMMDGFNNAGYITAGTGAVKCLMTVLMLGDCSFKTFSTTCTQETLGRCVSNCSGSLQPLAALNARCLPSSMLARRMCRTTTKARHGVMLMSRVVHLQVTMTPPRARVGRQRVCSGWTKCFDQCWMRSQTQTS